MAASNGGGSVSMESAIRTCKVDTAWADKVESDRFLNPDNMVCPLWNGLDTAGRAACPDSFMTKQAGCNSAEDRVVVENSVSRPQYMEYINLNSSGIEGDIYAGNEPYENSGYRTKDLQNNHNITGQFGLVTGYGQNVYPPCQGSGRSGSTTAYQQAMMQQNSRGAAAMENYSKGCGMRRASGF
jgi:hypothetical protein